MTVRAHVLTTTLAAVAIALLGAESGAAAELIVAFEDGAGAAERQAARDAAGARATRGAVHGLDARVVAVDGPAGPAIEELESSPAVRYAERNEIVTTAARRVRPNDPLLAQQYWLSNNGRAPGSVRDADIDAPEGWALARTRDFPARGGARVAVIDTGIDMSHPDLRGRTVACAQSRPPLLIGPRFVEGSCDDDHGHGTHIAGLLAARADNGEGIAGVAFDTRLIVCRALGQSGPIGGPGQGTIADVAACIDWSADRGADVISMSFEADQSATLQAAVQRAWRRGRGAVLVGAAGNDGGEATRHPAGARQVISVAATDAADRRASFSNFNPDVELAAAGSDLLSTALGGGYVRASGTSQATPIVAGVAAIVARANRDWSARRVRRQLTETADDLGARGRDPRFGHGGVNLCRALEGSCRPR